MKNKFHHLVLKNPNKQNIARKLSSCINKKYNDFQVILMEYSKKLRKKFKPVDIIYKPVKSSEKKFSVTTLKIYQNHTEILVEMQKNYYIGLLLNVILVESFLQDLTNKKDTLKIGLIFSE